MQLFAFVTNFGETFVGLGSIEYESIGPTLRKRHYVDITAYGMVLGTIVRKDRRTYITTTAEKALPYHTRAQVGRTKKAGTCTIHHLVSGEKLLIFTHK